jgi:Tetratricopeptide repeat
MGSVKRPILIDLCKRPLVGLLFCLASMAAAQTGPITLTDEQAALYLKAEQAMAAGQFNRAEEFLGQIIAQNPLWAGAWLDLAMLALRQEQYAQAEEFLLALNDRFAPLPPGIAQSVGQMQAQIRLKIKEPGLVSATAAQSTRQNMTTFAVGYEANANAGLQFSTLTLTLPDGDAIVNIDASSRARSATYARAAWLQQGQHPWEQGNLTWQLQAQARQYSLSQLDNTELLAQISMDQAQLPGRWMLGWQSIWLNSQPAYQTPLLRWQLDWLVSDQCGLQQHLQTEARQHPQASHLNARWQAYRASWRCQSAATRSQAHVQVATETADSDKRPGGNSLHRSWGVQHEWLQPFKWQDHSLLARLDVLRTRDSSTYSPLLDSGRPRQLNRTDGQLIWTGPWAGQGPWRWSIGLQLTRQSSNIQFFNQTNSALETSIWRAW